MARLPHRDRNKASSATLSLAQRVRAILPAGYGMEESPYPVPGYEAGSFSVWQNNDRQRLVINAREMQEQTPLGHIIQLALRGTPGEEPTQTMAGYINLVVGEKKQPRRATEYTFEVQTVDPVEFFVQNIMETFQVAGTNPFANLNAIFGTLLQQGREIRGNPLYPPAGRVSTGGLAESTEEFQTTEIPLIISGTTNKPVGVAARAAGMRYIAQQQQRGVAEYSPIAALTDKGYGLDTMHPDNLRFRNEADMVVTTNQNGVVQRLIGAVTKGLYTPKAHVQESSREPSIFWGPTGPGQLGELNAESGLGLAQANIILQHERTAPLGPSSVTGIGNYIGGGLGQSEEFMPTGTGMGTGFKVRRRANLASQEGAGSFYTDIIEGRTHVEMTAGALGRLIPGASKVPFAFITTEGGKQQRISPRDLSVPEPTDENEPFDATAGVRRSATIFIRGTIHFPRFYNTKGEGTPYGPMTYSSNVDISSSLPALQKALPGWNIDINASYVQPEIEMSGISVTARRGVAGEKGFGEKTIGHPTTGPAPVVSTAAGDIVIERLVGGHNVKNPEEVFAGHLAGRSMPFQSQMQLLEDYGGAPLRQAAEAAYPRGGAIDYGKVVQAAREQNLPLNEEIRTGRDLIRDIFQECFVKASPKENVRNLQLYRAGRLPDYQFTESWAPSQWQYAKEQTQAEVMRAYMEQGLSEKSATAKARKYIESRVIQEKQIDQGRMEVTQKVTEAWVFDKFRRGAREFTTGGANVPPEVAMQVVQDYPNLARKLGMDPSQPGYEYRGALDIGWTRNLQASLAHQELRRGGNLVPPGIYEMSPEQVTQFGAMEHYPTESDLPAALGRLVKRMEEMGLPAEAPGYYIHGMGIYPNPRNVLATENYEGSNTSADSLSSISRLLGVTNKMTEEIQSGRKIGTGTGTIALDALMSGYKSIFQGQGGAAKRVLGREAPVGTNVSYAWMKGLGKNEVYMPNTMLESMFRDAGAKEKQIRKAIKRLGTGGEGNEMFGLINRWPLQGNPVPFRLVGETEMRGRGYKPNLDFAGLGEGTNPHGDWDGDKALVLMGAKVVNGRLVFIQDQALIEAQRAGVGYTKSPAPTIEDKQFREGSSPWPEPTREMLSKKDVMAKAKGGYFDPKEIFEASVIGGAGKVFMGTNYNPRRQGLVELAAMGRSNEQVQHFFESWNQIYQPAIDFKMREAFPILAWGSSLGLHTKGEGEGARTVLSGIETPEIAGMPEKEHLFPFFDLNANPEEFVQRMATVATAPARVDTGSGKLTELDVPNAVLADWFGASRVEARKIQGLLKGKKGMERAPLLQKHMRQYFAENPQANVLDVPLARILLGGVYEKAKYNEEENIEQMRTQFMEKFPGVREAHELAQGFGAAIDPTRIAKVPAEALQAAITAKTRKGSQGRFLQDVLKKNLGGKFKEVEPLSGDEGPLPSTIPPAPPATQPSDETIQYGDKLFAPLDQGESQMNSEQFGRYAHAVAQQAAKAWDAGMTTQAKLDAQKAVAEEADPARRQQLLSTIQALAPGAVAGVTMAPPPNQPPPATTAAPAAAGGGRDPRQRPPRKFVSPPATPGTPGGPGWAHGGTGMPAIELEEIFKNMSGGGNWGSGGMNLGDADQAVNSFRAMLQGASVTPGLTVGRQSEQDLSTVLADLGVGSWDEAKKMVADLGIDAVRAKLSPRAVNILKINTSFRKIAQNAMKGHRALETQAGTGTGLTRGERGEALHLAGSEQQSDIAAADELWDTLGVKGGKESRAGMTRAQIANAEDAEKAIKKTAAAQAEYTKAIKEHGDIVGKHTDLLKTKADEIKSLAMDKAADALDIARGKKSDVTMMGKIERGIAAAQKARRTAGTFEEQAAAEGKISALEKAREEYGGAESKAAELDDEQAQIKKGRSLGAGMRKLFGGFGLMYMRSMTGMIMGNVGTGYAESLAEQQLATQAMAGAVGPTAGPVDSEEVVRRARATYGGGGKRAINMLEAQMLRTQPAAFGAAKAITAGIEGFAMSAWMADILAPGIMSGPAGLAVAGGIGLAVAGATVATNAYGAVKDTRGSAINAATRMMQGERLWDTAGGQQATTANVRSLNDIVRGATSLLDPTRFAYNESGTVTRDADILVKMRRAEQAGQSVDSALKAAGVAPGQWAKYKTDLASSKISLYPEISAEGIVGAQAYAEYAGFTAFAPGTARNRKTTQQEQWAAMAVGQKPSLLTQQAIGGLGFNQMLGGLGQISEAQLATTIGADIPIQKYMTQAVTAGGQAPWGTGKLQAGIMGILASPLLQAGMKVAGALPSTWDVSKGLGGAQLGQLSAGWQMMGQAGASGWQEKPMSAAELISRAANMPTTAWGGEAYLSATQVESQRRLMGIGYQTEGQIAGQVAGMNIQQAQQYMVGTQQRGIQTSYLGNYQQAALTNMMTPAQVQTNMAQMQGYTPAQLQAATNVQNANFSYNVSAANLGMGPKTFGNLAEANAAGANVATMQQIAETLESRGWVGAGKGMSAIQSLAKVAPQMGPSGQPIYGAAGQIQLQAPQPKYSQAINNLIYQAGNMNPEAALRLATYGVPTPAQMPGIGMWSDINQQGLATGQAWGTSTYQLGVPGGTVQSGPFAGMPTGYTAMQMGGKIFGSGFGDIGTPNKPPAWIGGGPSTNVPGYGQMTRRQAGYGTGISLGAEYGNKMLTGAAGEALWGAQQNYNFAMASAGLAMQGWNINYAFTTGVGLDKYKGTVNPQTNQPFGFNTGKWSVNVPGAGSYTSQGGGIWGAEDAQRNLGYIQQQWQFGMQQQGINLASTQFYQNMNLQQRQTGMQRQWQGEDWAFQSRTRGLQWQWHEEDFAENIRFMGGRQRRLAERQEGREVTMHGLEGEQIDKQKARQKEVWKLEDERFRLQKSQYEQNKAMQQEQLNMSKKFFDEQKKMQEEMVKLQRAEWVENMKNQKAQIGLQAAAAKAQLDVAKETLNQQTEVTNLQAIWAGLNQLMGSGLDNLTEKARSLMALLGGSTSGRGQVGTGKAAGGIITQHGFYELGEHGIEVIQPTFSPPATTTWAGAFLPNERRGRDNETQTIIINVGNERFGRYIVDKVTREVSV